MANAIRRDAAVDDLTLALHLADVAEARALSYFRSPSLHVEVKPDSSPVTLADREVETALRRELLANRPDDGVLGEELGADRAGSARCWILDPIDGTRSFIRGNETWAILIALREAGRVVAAVASTPALGSRYWAVRGGGAFLNGAHIHVSAVSTLGQALVAHTSLRGFVREGLTERLTALAQTCWDARGLGNSLAHLMVARGSADIGITARAQVWDFAALSLIVEEAGGTFTDLSSRGDQGGMGISSNGILHPAAQTAMGVEGPTDTPDVRA